jgi:2-amino-4-hydroxy-6-hydroxymethyldihydropteridine diphosphokinase
MRNAVRRIRQSVKIDAVSSLYETAPVGFQNQPPFLNAVLSIDSPDDPQELHRLLQEIEADLGRKRTFANAPRTIDIDILLFGEHVIADATLEIPHPKMTNRAFVLVPLAEIAPSDEHPVHGKSFRQLALELGDTSEDVWVVDGPEWVDRDRSTDARQSGR